MIRVQVLVAAVCSAPRSGPLPGPPTPPAALKKLQKFRVHSVRPPRIFDGLDEIADKNVKNMVQGRNCVDQMVNRVTLLYGIVFAMAETTTAVLRRD